MTSSFLRLRSTALLFSLTVLGCVMGLTSAHARHHNAPATLSIEARTPWGGWEELHPWTHRGRIYVAGEPGEPYALNVRNNTGGRLLAVLSIDGLNVITGEVAHPNQRGYILPPWGSVRITGWRKNEQESAAFYFTERGDAYADRIGKPRNVGVIGVAIFDEAFNLHSNPPLLEERERSDRYDGRARSPSAKHAEEGSASAEADQALAPAPSSAPSAKRHAETQSRQSLGTGHGARRFDPVRLGAFERRTTRPIWVQEIAYDSREALIRKNIIPRRALHQGRPQAFPDRGYVPDPPR